MIQGSEIGTETAGAFTPFFDQTEPFGVKLLLVESSNW